MSLRYSPEVGRRAVVCASLFVGLTEVRRNASWDDPSTPGKDAIAEEFRLALSKAGWQTGWPYCAAFCEAVWRKAYQGRLEATLIADMLTPGCMESWRRAILRGWTSQTPEIGAIGIMQKGEGALGHAFIVQRVEGDMLHTIEANTSASLADGPASREGEGVYCKTRKLSFKPTTGLHLLGFILPCLSYE